MSKLSDELSSYKQQKEQWINNLGLPQNPPDNTEMEKILKLDRTSIRERTSTMLSEDAVILSRYSLFLQRKTNECIAFLKWSSQISGRLFGDDRSQLNKWIRQIEIRLEHIKYLARRMEIISQNINNLIRTRYNEGKNE